MTNPTTIEKEIKNWLDKRFGKFGAGETDAHFEIANHIVSKILPKHATAIRKEVAREIIRDFLDGRTVGKL